MKLLVIYYTQSGQLEEIIHNLISPIENVDIDIISFRPKNNFPFPWPDRDFFNSMPESVLEIPVELENIRYKYEKYDLVIFGYQPWFLSPSIPATSLLHNEVFKKILNDTPVVTVIGSRNMWLNAQESVKKYIYEAGGKLIGCVPLIDKTTNLISAITTVHWMRTGRKTRKLGFFPIPGVSDSDIKGVSKIGMLLNSCLVQNQLYRFQNEVIEAGAVIINPNLMFIEERAKKIFLIWARLIKQKEKTGSRGLWIRVFKYYLLVALFLVSPIFLIIYNIFVRPFSTTSLRRKKAYYASTQIMSK